MRKTSPYLKRRSEKRNLHNLEANWNDSVNVAEMTESRARNRLLDNLLSQKNKGDIREKKSVSGSRDRTENDWEGLYHDNDQSTFTCISSALGFIHHRGTDRKLELNVLKHAIIRENLLSNLSHQVQEAIKETNAISNGKLTRTSLKIFDILAAIRNETLLYLESLCIWRMTVIDYDPLSPRSFYWNNCNYTLKLIDDLNFLVEYTQLLSVLGIPESKVTSNPLMLSTSLYDRDDYIDPREKALRDTNGNDHCIKFEERLRLRKSERLLRQEIELCKEKSNETNHEKKSMNSDKESLSSEDTRDMKSNYYDIEQAQINFTKWIEDARLQLETLRKSQGERLTTRSTNRLEKIQSTTKHESNKTNNKLGHISTHNNSKDWKTEPTKLTELISSKLNRSIIKRSDKVDEEEQLSDLIINHDHSEDIYPNESSILKSNSEDVDHKQDQDEIDLTNEDITILGDVSNPSIYLRLVGAVIVVLLSKRDVEKKLEEIDWKSFQLLSKTPARSHELLLNVNYYQLSPNNFLLIQSASNKFKEFLMSSDLDYDDPLLKSLERMIRWIYNNIRKVLAYRRKNKQNQTTMMKESKSVPTTRTNKTNTTIKSNRLKPLNTDSNPRPHSIDNPLRESINSSFEAIHKNMSNDTASSNIHFKKPRNHQYPLYSQVVHDLYHHTVLLSLMTSTNMIPITTKTMKPMDNNQTDSVGQLIVKVYDVVDSREASMIINIREYLLHLNHLHSSLGAMVLRYYNPSDPHWWIENLTRIVRINDRKNGSLYVNINKIAIETYVEKCLNESSYIEDNNVQNSLESRSSEVEDNHVQNSSESRTSEKIQSEEIKSKSQKLKSLNTTESDRGKNSPINEVNMMKKKKSDVTRKSNTKTASPIVLKISKKGKSLSAAITSSEAIEVSEENKKDTSVVDKDKTDDNIIQELQLQTKSDDESSDHHAEESEKDSNDKQTYDSQRLSDTPRQSQPSTEQSSEDIVDTSEKDELSKTISKDMENKQDNDDDDRSIAKDPKSPVITISNGDQRDHDSPIGNELLKELESSEKKIESYEEDEFEKYFFNDNVTQSPAKNEQKGFENEEDNYQDDFISETIANSVKSPLIRSSDDSVYEEDFQEISSPKNIAVPLIEKESVVVECKTIQSPSYEEDYQDDFSPSPVVDKEYPSASTSENVNNNDIFPRHDVESNTIPAPDKTSNGNEIIVDAVKLSHESDIANKFIGNIVNHVIGSMKIKITSPKSTVENNDEETPIFQALSSRYKSFQSPKNPDSNNRDVNVNQGDDRFHRDDDSQSLNTMISDCSQTLQCQTNSSFNRNDSYLSIDDSVR